MVSQQRETLTHNPDSESTPSYALAIHESKFIPIMPTAVRGQELAKRAAK
jgi:hypothetical protein